MESRKSFLLLMGVSMVSGGSHWKGAKAFWHKRRRTHRDFHRFTFGVIGIISVDNFLSQLANPRHIVQGFPQVGDHKIQLYLWSIRRWNAVGTGLHQLFFRHIFVDNIAQALGTRFRRECQTASAHGLEFSEYQPRQEKLSTRADGNKIPILPFPINRVNSSSKPSIWV